MKQVFAITKTTQFVKLFDENDNFGKDNLEIFSKLGFCFPKINSEIEYQDLGANLQTDEWFFVKLSDVHKNLFLGKYLNLNNSTEQYNLADNENYKNMQNIFMLEGDKILFSYIEPRFAISKKRYKFFFDQGIIIDEEKESVVFEGRVYAFFDGVDKIYFQKFGNARKIFGQEFSKAFEKMAKDNEAIDFLKSDFFEGFDEKQNISDRNKKMIASIMERKEVFENPENLQKFIEYGKTSTKYPVEISDNGKFILNSPTNIRNTLFLLEERIYITPITNEERVAISFEQ